MRATIGITTFLERFEFVEKLVGQIRSFTDVDIILAINGQYKQNFDNDYRVKILNLCSKYNSVFPIFFTETRGLSKMWNTIIVHSCNDLILVLNDDIEFFNDDFVNLLKKYENENEGLIMLNNTFSFFLVFKKTIDELGYFDERLIGFGWEDGDIMWRHIELYNKPVGFDVLGGVINHMSNYRDEKIIRAGNKYSSFNKNFLYYSEGPKYVLGGSIKGPFSNEHIKNIPDERQYPYEKFFLENKNKL
jgi:hypothetical protein